MDNPRGWHECQKCSQVIPHANLFLCKGRMLCTACYMIETKGNTVCVTEDKYPRTRDIFGNPMKYNY